MGSHEWRKSMRSHGVEEINGAARVEEVNGESRGKGSQWGINEGAGSQWGVME